jgi:predicted MPP superfamily phosphohydrolase
MRHFVFPLLSILLFGVVYAWATASIPWCGRHRRATGLALFGVWAGELAARRIEMQWHVGTGITVVGEILVMTLVLTAVPLGILRAVSLLADRVRPAPAPAPEAPAAMTRRQLVEAGTGAALLATTGSMIGWGMARGRDGFELDEIAVRIVGLPRALDGYVIAQISDIHAGDYVGERMLDEGFERVRQARADLLVVTGDVVDTDATFAPMFARRLADNAPRDGVFACLGNHDYYAGAGRVMDVLRAAGVRTLVNDGLLIRPGDGGGFALLGVDDQWSNRYRGPGARLDLALAKVAAAAPRVLLSHQPPTVDRWAGQVALQLSGHTHGGQINPLGLRPADVFFKYVSGRYPVGETTLYVNRGFGTVGPPARVNAPPEITRIVLVAA